MLDPPGLHPEIARLSPKLVACLLAAAWEVALIPRSMTAYEARIAVERASELYIELRTPQEDLT